ncbi:MAG TPA: hypothetical protein PLD58_19325 [Phycisphaerae bacterium]|nr:hypothetical protein [Phycisphaerae bacterium]
MLKYLSLIACRLSGIVLAVCACLSPCRLTAEEIHGGGELAARLSGDSGLPESIVLHNRPGEAAPDADRNWLHGPLTLEVRAEAAKKTAAPTAARLEKKGESLTGQAALAGLGLTVTQKWTPLEQGLMWEMDFAGAGSRTEHKITIQLPALDPGMRVFTPSERGVMNLDAHPTYGPATYAAVGWGSGRAWVLPLISLLATDGRALTIALPPTDNIPNLTFAWKDATTLELGFAHRGMGGGKPSPLRLVFYSHAADYRAALAAYAGQFPEYFRSPLPRGQGEGVFYYHHIQDHPDLDEMARQRVRYIWSSFWFTYLGEYLPEEKEWHPYTYAKWWKLGQTMSDEKINAFVAKMKAAGVATYAYFNVTEYGGDGGKGGDAEAAARALRERFANALVKNASGKDIPTWEGAMAMNPGPNYALWPFLVEQVKRHLDRLPEIAGFVIDRLDWASTIDYGHDDGLTMIRNKPAENMALPVAAAVREVCRLAHEKGKRVFVNQFYRIEPLRDTDGTCHENDYLPALGYLTPLRPASAWHHAKPYGGDLLQFEAQLKRRLHWKLFPQMIAHKFPISQQPPNEKAADFLEIYAPLFERLMGCEQVLRPHCVQAGGPCDVNLYADANGHLVVPVTSRVDFLSRPGAPSAGAPVVSIRGMGHDARWAHVYPLGGRPYKASVVGAMARAPQTPSRADTVLSVSLQRHEVACVIVVGHGDEPPLDDKHATRLIELREKLFGKSEPSPLTTEQLPRPDLAGLTAPTLRISGDLLGSAGPIDVLLGGRKVGTFTGSACSLPLPALPGDDLRITLQPGDEGVWLLPRRAEIVARRGDGQTVRVARWTSGMPTAGQAGATALVASWAGLESVAAASVKFEGRDVATAGKWTGKYGSLAAWIPNVPTAAQRNYRLDVLAGQPFTWPGGQKDPRSLAPPGAKGRPAATCWHEGQRLSFLITPSDTLAAKPYRLTVYVLDYDRNKRSMAVGFGEPAQTEQTAAIDETDKGVYLTWTVSGEVQIDVRKLAGFNAVISGIFIDPVK